MTDKGKRILAEGKYLRFIDEGGWEYVQRVNISGIVGMVPVTDDGKLVLIEQRRPAVGGRVIELPAGLVGDVPGREAESMATAAERELEEETGYRARHWRRLVEGVASAGVSGERLTLYLATGLEKVSTGGGDESEDIYVHEVPLPDVHEWLADCRRRGLEIDLKIYIGLFFAMQSRKGPL